MPMLDAQRKSLRSPRERGWLFDRYHYTTRIQRLAFDLHMNILE